MVDDDSLTRLVQPDAPYGFGGDDDAEQRWWRESVRERAADPDAWRRVGGGYQLRIRCPRCGHEITQVLDFSRVMGEEGFADAAQILFDLVDPARGVLPAGRRRLRVRTRSGTFDIVCRCPHPHEGRPEGKSGCGWGRGMAVRLDRPTLPGGS